MADIFDKATRSRIMRAIKGSNTGPERAMRREFRRLGLRPTSSQAYIRYWLRLPGTPDFAFETRRLAVFVHGCFWHRCPAHCKVPRLARWRRKLEGNRLRDARVRRRLRQLGWRTMVVWEHEVPATAAVRVQRRLGRAA